MRQSERHRINETDNSAPEWIDDVHALAWYEADVQVRGLACCHTRLLNECPARDTDETKPKRKRKDA